MEITLDLVSLISNKINISTKQVMAALTLLIKEQCTIPFISRYRKEITGGLDEVQIRNIHETYLSHIELEKRRGYILETIKKMEKLTPELEKKIKIAENLNTLEDIYAPFKSKRKTKGQVAQEAGLLPLADLLISSTESIDEIESNFSAKYINKDKKILTWSDALNGAKYILMERFAHDTELKENLRKTYWSDATLSANKKKDAEKIDEWQKFRDYFEFEQNVSDLKDPKKGHRFLAMRRGMTLGILKVDVNYDTKKAVNIIENKYFTTNTHETTKTFLRETAQKALSLYIHSSLDLEIKSELKQLADESAIDVFKENLKNLLLQPYLGPHAVLAIDPGVRTGCKIVIISATGELLEDYVIYPHEPRKEVQQSAAILEALIQKHEIKHIAIGNGTFGRETLHFVEDNIIQVKQGQVHATLISESGASIYSASDIARKEFPDKDVTVRGAVSIGRRFQDPLAELVKIDPKSIGVGQYQHDVNQAKLKRSLTGVVEDCVNHVGVNINTASAPLLSFISGIGPTMAKNIVEYRHAKGKFTKREQLLAVSRFSEKIFQQSAGFLKIYDGENPLDQTFIHPEQYSNIQSWAKSKNIKLNDLIKEDTLRQEFKTDENIKTLIGEFTINDIVANLQSPGQDPRTEFKSTDFRKDVRTINDLKLNEWYPGIVTNITKFGAFVDLGIKENGLLHVSEMSDHFVSDPMSELKVGEEVKVKIKEIDFDRKRIALTRKKNSDSAATSGYVHEKTKASHPRIRQEAATKNNPFASLKNLKLPLK